MKKFNDILSEKYKEYDVILTEEEGDLAATGANGFGGGDTSLPNDVGNASVAIDDGATPAPRDYEYPLQELAAITYQALEKNMHDIEGVPLKAILKLDPMNITSDVQGSAIIKAIKEALDGVPDPATEE